MKLAFAAVVFFSLCFLAVKSPAQATVPETIPGEWELKPLALVGMPAPGASARFEFIDLYFHQPVWIPSGFVTFWANTRPKDANSVFGIKDNKIILSKSDDQKFWGLYSVKDGKVVKVFNEAELLTVTGTDKAKVERSYDFLRVNALVAGKNILYINASQSIWSGKISIFSWDGDNLKLFLGNDSKLEIDGITYNVHSAYVRQAFRDGKALVVCTTNKPKTRVFELFHDGEKFIPVRLIPEEDKPLPGMPGVLFDGMPVMPYFIPSVHYDGGLIARMKVKGAPYKDAVFRITPEKAEKIIAVGDADPFDSTKKIQSILWISGADKNSVAFVVSSAKKLEPVLMIYRDGKFQKVFDNTYPSVKDKAQWLLYSIGGGSFMSSDSSSYFFSVTLHRKSDLKDYKYELLPHFFFFDGENLHHLSENAPTTQLTRALWMSWLGKGVLDTKGIIFQGVGSTGYRLFDSGYAFYFEQNIGNSWLFESTGKIFTFKPAPEFNVPGKKISLGNVIGWKSPTEAFVRLDDGIYQLSRRN